MQFRLLKPKANRPLSAVIRPTPPKEKPTPVPVPVDNPHTGVKTALVVPDRLNKPHPVVTAWFQSSSPQSGRT